MLEAQSQPSSRALQDADNSWETVIDLFIFQGLQNIREERREGHYGPPWDQGPAEDQRCRLLPAFAIRYVLPSPCTWKNKPLGRAAGGQWIQLHTQAVGSHNTRTMLPLSRGGQRNDAATGCHTEQQHSAVEVQTQPGQLCPAPQ